MKSENREVRFYQYGNTVRFEVTFCDFEGRPIQPDEGSVKLKIYNHRYDYLSPVEGYIPTNANDPGEDKTDYFYDYETEPKEQRLFYEWFATIDSKPSLRRGEFATRFI